MKHKDKMCYCGKSKIHENDTDWKFGVTLWFIITIVGFLIFGPLFGAIVAGLPLAVYVTIVMYSKAKGHSLQCALRKSINDTLDILSFFSSIG